MAALIAKVTGELQLIVGDKQQKAAADPSQEEFAAAIADERFRQIEKGYDSEHDDEHGVDHLLGWAQDYARRGEVVKSAALVQAARDLIARSAS